jgi:TolB-like protein/tetratricopeptide (TPR) repeat protein
MRFLKELRRRRVFRVAGLYVVALWLLMQAANIVFPAWSIPDAAIRYLIWAGLLGFPLALAFGWVFDISTEGIRRTQPVSSENELLQSLPLRRADYVILTAFLVVMGAIVYDTTGRVMETTTATSAGGLGEWLPSQSEIEPHSVAVLPFASLSSDPEHEYFADGISEEILNRLSAFGELKVIARTSSFAFKGSSYDIGRISGLLAVNYLLQGSVRRDGQQLRITAQLVDRTGVQVWSSTFDRQLGAIFALQDEIAEAVATSIVPRIVPPIVPQREPDLEAYQQYLIGREILARRASLWPQRSAERFTRAIELDPEFAEPYAGRAIARVANARWAREPEIELDLAQQDSNTALALSPDLALAYAAQGLLEQSRNPQDHSGREAVLRRALALDPNLIDAMNWLARALASQGRHDDAIGVYHTAVRIDPLAPAINANLAMEEARRGRFEEAELRLRRLMAIPQPPVWVSGQLAEIHRLSGRLVESTDIAKRTVLTSASVTGLPGGVHRLIGLYSTLGMREAAIYWHGRYEQAWPEIYQVSLLGFVLSDGHLDPGERLAGMVAALNEQGIEPGTLGTEWSIYLGVAQALAGEHDDAIRTLTQWIDPDVAFQAEFEMETGARHALAWAWLQTGEEYRARAMLGLMDAHFREQQAEGRLHLSGEIFDYAQSTLLLGEAGRAVDLLDQAAEAGWRGYYAILHDPRWDSVRDEPKFRDVTAKLKADIDQQRARMEGIDAEDDFAARLDAVLAAREAAADARAGGAGGQNR